MRLALDSRIQYPIRSHGTNSSICQDVRNWPITAKEETPWIIQHELVRLDSNENCWLSCTKKMSGHHSRALSYQLTRNIGTKTRLLQKEPWFLAGSKFHWLATKFLSQKGIEVCFPGVWNKTFSWHCDMARNKKFTGGGVLLWWQTEMFSVTLEPSGGDDCVRMCQEWLFRWSWENSLLMVVGSYACVKRRKALMLCTVSACRHGTESQLPHERTHGQLQAQMWDLPQGLQQALRAEKSPLPQPPGQRHTLVTSWRHVSVVTPHWKQHKLTEKDTR